MTMDSNLIAQLVREVVTAIADHADAVRELADAVRDHAANQDAADKPETMDD